MTTDELATNQKQTVETVPKTSSANTPTREITQPPLRNTIFDQALWLCEQAWIVKATSTLMSLTYPLPYKVRSSDSMALPIWRIRCWECTFSWWAQGHTAEPSRACSTYQELYQRNP